MIKIIKVSTLVSLLCLLLCQLCYGATPVKTSTPKNGQMFYGDIPSYYSEPKYHDIGMGYSGNNIIGVNKTGKNILEWVYDEKLSALSKIREGVRKVCQDKGYSTSASSNIKIELDKPLDSVYMILFSYEINCW